jgi:hypothetical protein
MINKKTVLILCLLLILVFVLSGCKNDKVLVTTTQFTTAKIFTTEIYTNPTEKHHTYEIEYPNVSLNDKKDVEPGVNTSIQQHLQYVVEDYQMLFDKDNPQSLTGEYEVMLLSDNILCIKWLLVQMMEGAAHPNNTVSTLTIDLSTGRTAYFEDMFKDGTDFIGKMNKIIKKIIDDKKPELLTPYKGIEGMQDFYITATEFIVYYNTGTYTPHALGPLEFRIPLSEINDILKIKP